MATQVEPGADARWQSGWRRDGYLILRNALPAADVDRLRGIAERARDEWQAHSTADSEPGGHAYGPNAWSLLHLNHPRYHAGQHDDLLFVLATIAHPVARLVMRAVFGEEALFMQMNLYVDPAGEGWPGVWHRDCQFFSGGSEDKMRELLFAEADPPRELHMHIPLLPTQATEVVPGSHNRDDTPDERAVRVNDSSSDLMPNALALQLQPGDLAFFHVNSIHRGRYFHGISRRTIAITYSRRSRPRLPTREWMISGKGYVAPYQPWFLQPGYLDGLDAEARAFLQSFLDVYRPYLTPELLVPELGEKRIAYYRTP